jgi:outer membrane protein W
MMNKAMRKTALASLLFFLFAPICAADTASREGSAKKFAQGIQHSLPFTALTTLAWSDAYIGQLISRKPHFGAGLAYGMSTTDFSAVRGLLDELDANGYLNTDGVFMPPLSVHARIGGFFVPFDIGFVASLPVYARPGDDVTSKQQTLGGDIRFTLVREDTKAPSVSVGVAYIQTEGSLSAAGSAQNIDVYWEGGAVEIKAQISKTFQTITPYLGAGGSYTWSQAGYETDKGEKWGMEPGNFANDILFRLFGGASIKLWALRLDLSISVSVPDAVYGVVSGLRFQL